MALQTLARPIHWPNLVFQNGNPARGGTITIDAAGEYIAMVFRATEAMTISHVAFSTWFTATGSPTIDIRIETVDATTGLPTGTLWGTNTNVVSSTLSASTEYIVALTASASISGGDVVALVFKYNSGTAIVLTQLNNGGYGGNNGLPYYVSNTGTPAKFAPASASCFSAAVGSGATSFYKVLGMMPLSSSAAQTFSTTNGDAFGNRFQVPFKCRCVGLAFNSTTSTGEYTYGLYNNSGTELSSSSTSFDIDQIWQTSGNRLYMYFDNPVTLDPATWYRAALWPTSTTNVGVTKIKAATNTTTALPFTNFHYTTKASGGAWTDTATDEALFMDLLIDQLDDAVSASSGGGLKLAGRGGLAG